MRTASAHSNSTRMILVKAIEHFEGSVDTDETFGTISSHTNERKLYNKRLAGYVQDRGNVIDQTPSNKHFSMYGSF